jgi:hypothetical protein
VQGKERVEEPAIMFPRLVIAATLRDEMKNVDTEKRLETEDSHKIKETRQDQSNFKVVIEWMVPKNLPRQAHRTHARRSDVS